MTKLTHHFPRVMIKSNKKLIESCNFRDDYIEDFELTIADVMDNAEYLFGKKKHHIYNFKFEDIQHDILEMCQENKTIKEIGDYIIKNIK